MIDQDQFLLERAYLSISKAMSPNPMISRKEDEEDEENQTEEIVSAGPLTEPAPGVDVEMIADDEPDVEHPMEISSEGPEMSIDDSECGCHDEESDISEEEQEEDEMSIDNLNSIRESIMKIASFCATGGHLEAWQQQKLAIAMDNLAGVARSLR